MAVALSGDAKVRRLSAFVLAGFILITLNLFRMQVLKGGYYRSLSERNRIRVIYLEAPRGQIFDRNGVVLATSRLSFNCSVFPREAKKKMDESLEAVALLMGADAEALKRSVSRKKPGVFNTVLVSEDISQEEAIAIEERLDSLPGFMIETRPVREYPLAEASAHLVGYTGPVTEEEVGGLGLYGYHLFEWLGREGLEKSYEAYLHGFSGGLQIETDNRGKLLRALGVKEPKEGKDLHLTVDARLQTTVQELLGAQRGAVIVMNVQDGDILSLNSSPSFDPNLFSSRKGRKDVDKYLQGEGSPMVNRAIQGGFPPGSIFKIITALAALETGKASPGTTFNCSGYLSIGGKLFHCWKETGHGAQGMTEAFAHSCNVYFYHLGLLSGPDKIFQKSLDLGLAQLTGVDLAGEKEGFVPSKEWKRSRRHENWFTGETANLAIGQGYLQVTPIQAVAMVAAVATEGRKARPHLVDRIERTNVAEKSVKYTRTPAAHWLAVKRGLHAVINSDSGTGRLARVPNLSIAGKTGTAESGQDKSHAWFVGFAPEEDPKIAMVVFLEHGGRGGVSAATMAAQIFKWLQGAGYL